MNTDSLQKPLRTLGVTPWQAIVGIALVGFYLGEMKPKLASGEKLTSSVDKLTETVATQTAIDVQLQRLIPDKPTLASVILERQKQP